MLILKHFNIDIWGYRTLYEYGNNGPPSMHNRVFLREEKRGSLFLYSGFVDRGLNQPFLSNILVKKLFFVPSDNLRTKDWPVVLKACERTSGILSWFRPTSLYVSRHLCQCRCREVRNSHGGSSRAGVDRFIHPSTFNPPLVLLCFFCTPAPVPPPPFPPPPFPFFPPFLLSCGTVGLISVVLFRNRTG